MPPLAVMVTVAKPPLQEIVLCDTLLTEITAGSTILNVPVADAQKLASVTLYERLLPDAWVKIPVVLVTPSKV